MAEGRSSSGRLQDLDFGWIWLVSRNRGLPVAQGAHLRDAFLGFFVATLLLNVLWSCFKGFTFRRLLRREQAVAEQALREVDKSTLKKVLGNVPLPSWITFPDFERVSWVNTVLEQLWPYASAAICSSMRERLASTLADQKPAGIASIKIFRFDLGDKPPQANGIKVFKSPALKDQVIIEADYIWAGNQDVQLVVQPIHGGLGALEPVGKALGDIISLRVGTEKVIATGRLRIILKPLMEDLPIIAAVHVAFVEMPDIRLNLTLYGGDMSFLPGLESFLASFVKESLLRPYVLPEAFVYPLVDPSNIGIEKPCGMLFVKVVEATQVPKMDLLSNSDPFVRLFVRERVMLQSEVKQSSSNPVWNEDFKFLVHEPEYQTLTAILYDFDRFNKDDEIGRVTIPLSDLPHGKKQDLWLDIFDYAADAEQNKFHGKHVFNGLIGTAKNVKNMTAAAIARFERRLPGIDRDRKCLLHMEMTYYEFRGQEVETAEQEMGMTPLQTPSPENSAEEASMQAPARYSGHAAEGDRDGGESSAAPRSRDGHGGSAAQPSARISQSSMSRDVVNALKGGVLFVKPRTASNVKRKPWFRGGVLGSTSTCKVTCAGATKHTTTAHGPDPLFTESLEFLIGDDVLQEVEHQMVTVELWDYRLSSSFQGSVRVPLKEVLEKQRIKQKYELQGVSHGELVLEVQWMSAISRPLE